MACGGSVGKYEEGGEVTLSPAEKLKNKLFKVNDKSLDTLKDKLADRSQRTQEVFNTHDHYTNNTSKGPMGTSVKSGGGGSSGTSGSAEIKILQNPRAIKKGGRVNKKVGTVKKNK